MFHAPPKTVSCLSRAFSTSAVRSADFTYGVIGAGAVGLSVARKLQSREGASTILIERHGHFGNETSSRNSEVVLSFIHLLRTVGGLIRSRSSTLVSTTAPTP